ncbi:MAG: glycosyltransferase family 4 protein, partial [Candidatus Odinarchaeia archaeon]
RVEKEARSLTKAGHEIFLLTAKRNTEPVEENVSGIDVIRIEYPKNTLKKLYHLLRFSVNFFDSLWGKKIEEIVLEKGIDVIHVNDLKLVKTGLKIARKIGVPIVADLHENYPEALKQWRKSNRNFKARIVNAFNPVWRWQRLERNILRKVDKIITVVDEAKQHYINDCGVDPSKITVVMNTVDINYIKKIPVNKELISKYSNTFTITYTGGVGIHRGVDTVIKSLPKVKERVPDIKLLLIGFKGKTEYEKKLKKLSKNLDVYENIEFIKWAPFKDVINYIKASKICLIPHRTSGHTNTTIPHKLFHYMMLKKPVIVTDAKPLKRIVEECKCGLVIPSGNYEKMAKAIIKIYDDKELALRLGENGEKAVKDKYNWEVEAKKLIKLYEEIR